MQLSPDSGKILSLIIPSYNMERYLAKCLDSLIVPGFENVEVLVVNDGSKDRTLEIARDYERRYPDSIRVINKPNGNYGSCINAALPLATGKYIRTLDADDTFDSTNFTVYLRLLPSIDADIILTDYSRVDEDEKTLSIKRYESIEPAVIKTFEDILNEVDENIAMHATTYRRSIFANLDYKQTEGISYTDNEWMFYPFAEGKTFYRLPIVVYRHLLGRTGQTIEENTFLTRTKDFIRIIERMASYHQNFGEHDERKEYLVNYLTRLLQWFYSLILMKPRKDALQNLTIFDKEIERAYPELNSHLNKFTIFPAIQYPFVKQWRAAGRPSKWRIPFSVNLRRAINRIKIILLPQ